MEKHQDNLMSQYVNICCFYFKKTFQQRLESLNWKNSCKLRSASFQCKGFFMETREVWMSPIQINTLVGGFNPSDKYWSSWIISPGKGKKKTYKSCLKPPPRCLWSNPSPTLFPTFTLGVGCSTLASMVTILAPNKNPGSRSLIPIQCCDLLSPVCYL